jgi:hypothetical protein
MPGVVTNREQPDRFNSSVVSSQDLYVVGLQVPPDAVSGTYLDYPVVLSNDSDTSSCLGNVGFFFDPPEGRLGERPRGRWYAHKRSPMKNKPA